MVIATTNDILLDATSPTDKRLIVWKDKQGLINVMTLNPNSEINVTIATHRSIASMLEQMEFHSWVLQGIKSKELETAIQKYL